MNNKRVKLFTWTCTNQTTSWLVRSWNLFGAWTNHGHTRIHKTHHDFDLGEVTTFPLIVFFVISHRGYIQMSFCFGIPKLGVSKFPKLGLLAFWKAITFCVNLQLRWGLKKICNPHWELSKDMLHATCMHVFQGDSWLLMVESQIGTLTFDPSFGHNLFFKYSNKYVNPF
jgi:hypothetical protein